MAIRKVAISPRTSPVDPISTRSRPRKCARHFSADDNLARIDVRRNFAVRPDGDAAVGQMDRALNLAIDVQVIAAAHFALNQ